MRKTKIVCTIGPASESEEMLTKLALAGMNVARLNFSHGTHEEHKRRISSIRKISNNLNLPIAILLDTKGPEFRIKTFKNGKVALKAGDTFTFTSDDCQGDEKKVSVNFKGLEKDVHPDDHILVCNGLMDFIVKEINGTDVICETLTDGTLSDRKSMNFPGKIMSTTFLSEQDKEDILFGIEQGVDFIACSFVSRKQDLADVRDFLAANGNPDIELIAKIENQPGIDNIEEICELCSGIMIGRGDMGVPGGVGQYRAKDEVRPGGSGEKRSVAHRARRRCRAGRTFRKHRCRSGRTLRKHRGRSGTAPHQHGFPGAQ